MRSGSANAARTERIREIAYFPKLVDSICFSFFLNSAPLSQLKVFFYFSLIKMNIAI